jgi:hypothetical protein
MKKALLAFTMVLLLGPLSGLEAQPPGPPMKHRGKVITPYGDFCSKCSKYGRGGRQVRMREAMSAVEAYFNVKGLKVKHIRGTKRFLVIDVYREDEIVDTILFDRRSGRLRSIY